MKYSTEWEEVKRYDVNRYNEDFETYRLQVPHGWLVTVGGLPVFVPDIDHDWKLKRE